MLYADIASDLLRVRHDLGITQRQAAEKVGIAFATYCLAETAGRMGFKVRGKVTRWLAKQTKKGAKR